MMMMFNRRQSFPSFSCVLAAFALLLVFIVDLQLMPTCQAAAMAIPEEAVVDASAAAEVEVGQDSETSSSDELRRVKRQPGTCVNHWYNWDSQRESNCRAACRNDGCYSGYCEGERCRCFRRNYSRC